MFCSARAVEIEASSNPGSGSVIDLKTTKMTERLVAVTAAVAVLPLLAGCTALAGLNGGNEPVPSETATPVTCSTEGAEGEATESEQQACDELNGTSSEAPESSESPEPGQDDQDGGHDQNQQDGGNSPKPNHTQGGSGSHNGGGSTHDNGTTGGHNDDRPQLTASPRP